MARYYRKVEIAMWIDDRFRSLSSAPPNAQTLWFYLLTGPRTVSLPGIVIGREAVLADDLGWPMEGFREAFGEVSREGLAKANWKAGLVVLERALFDSFGEPRESSKPESPNVIKHWEKSWDLIPECELKSQYLRQLGSFCEALGEGFAKAYREAFRKALAKPSANQVTGNREQGTVREGSPGLADLKAKVDTITGDVGRKRAEKREPDPALKSAIAAFDTYFRDTHGGSKPTWNSKTVAMLKGLVAKHGVDEVTTRIESLQKRPPGWPPAPWDLATFVAHFDKCAPSQPEIAWIAPIA